MNWTKNLNRRAAGWTQRPDTRSASGGVTGSFDQPQKVKLGNVAVVLNDGGENMFEQVGIAAE